MKAEINNENKEKFFSLYWGQEVIRDTNNSNQICTYAVNQSNMYRFDDSYLQLKPLSQISDEDAIEVAKIINPTAFNFLLIERECHVCVWFENARVLIYPEFSFTSYSERVIPEGGFGGNGSIGLWVEHGSILFSEHYLRSRGYSLPCMGLSVDEMVEAGWIRLI